MTPAQTVAAILAAWYLAAGMVMTATVFSPGGLVDRETGRPSPTRPTAGVVATVFAAWPFFFVVFLMNARPRR